MRKSKAETAETRRRILEAASAEFRANGIHATGIAEVMAAAGLTQGGFYRHFASKDQLVAEACAAAMTAAVSSTEDGPDHGCGKLRLDAIVAAFLSADPADNHLQGCPLVGLGIELSRADETIRDAASAGFNELVDLIARQYPRTTPHAARSRAIFVLCAMVGAATLSRIVTDPALSEAILDAARTQLARK